MLVSSDYILLFCILLSLVALGAVITIGNERVRQATLQVRDMAQAYALADLAIRREQARATFTFSNPADGLKTLSQIALDVTGQRHEFVQLSIANGPVTAITVLTKDGSEAVFTPSADAYLKGNPAKRKHVQQTHLVNGLVSGPFVVEELSALAQFLGVTALPRTEQWNLIWFAPEDYGVMGVPALRRLKFKFE